MELSVVLFILKIIILYIFVPCLLLASIFSLIYTFITTYHDKKNKDMVKVTCETMYCDKENKNRSIAGTINFLGTISKETFDNYKALCNFKIGDVVYVSDLDKMFIYNGSNLIEICNDGYDYLKKKKNMKSSINYNNLTDKDYKESDLLDNINKEIDQIIKG